MGHGNGFYWVLLGFTGFYWVLLGFYWVKLSFTVFFSVFYWVRQGSTGLLTEFVFFYRVFFRNGCAFLEGPVLVEEQRRASANGQFQSATLQRQHQHRPPPQVSSIFLFLFLFLVGYFPSISNEIHHVVSALKKSTVNILRLIIK